MTTGPQLTESGVSGILLLVRCHSLTVTGSLLGNICPTMTRTLYTIANTAQGLLNFRKLHELRPSDCKSRPESKYRQIGTIWG